MMLSVRDLKVSFHTDDGLVRAIDGVSFDLEEGEILGVVGESGSGKTVSLLAVMGLITDPNAVIEGSIRYRGRELVGLPARELRRLRGNEIAMIFQDPMTALTPVYTIGWQIAEQIQAHRKVSRSVALARVEELLAEVNFPNPREAMSRYPHQLSGGMRKRVSLAQTFINEPEILLMDEPFSALDVQTRTVMHEELLRLWAERKASVIFVTHDLEEAVALADKVYVLTAGPATVKSVYPINLPRPRVVADIRYEPRFIEYCRTIWEDLRDEVEMSYRRASQAA